MTERAVDQVVVVEDVDVLATVGVPGLLESRLGNTKLRRMPAGRSDLLLQRLAGTSPPALDIPDQLSSWWESQRPSGVASEALYVFSIHSDLLGPHPLVHEGSGFLVDAPPETIDAAGWSPSTFHPSPPLTPTETIANFEAIADLLSASGATAVVIGASSFDPADQTHDYRDQPNTFGIVTNRVLAGMQTLASDRDWGFVDVDRTIAELGGAQHVTAPGAFSQEAAKAATEDAIDMISDHGRFGAAILPPVMTVEIPAVHVRTRTGRIDTWHASEGDVLAKGEPMVRVKFAVTAHNQVDVNRNMGRIEKWRRKRRRAHHTTGRTMSVDLLAGADVNLASIIAPVGAEVDVGRPVALVTTTSATTAGIEDAAGTLRTDVRSADE